MIGTFWIVNDTLKRILSGPFLWDDSGPMIPVTAPVRVVSTLPANYSSGSMDCAALALRVTALENRVLGEVKGSAYVPSIANVLGGTVTARVIMKAPVRNSAGEVTTNFVATPVLIPGNITGTLKTGTVTIIDAQTVDVQVVSSGLITLGQATVLVFADVNP